MRHSLARREFLSAAGVSIALPMLETMVPAARADQSQAVKRFVCMSNNYGVYRDAFFPDAKDSGADYTMPETLKPLEAHRNDLTLFSNLDHGNTIVHHGVPVLLSGVRPHLASYYE